ncbi:unnamed protein product [Rotaria magnacalcarata]|nr:unnamed protein product [Rotaria magnacalcarata]
MNKKRQYCYDTVHLRTTDQYFKLSKKAERTQSNIRGHLGESVLNNILDVEFPEAIVLDCVHVSLLGHAKLIILSVYKQLKPAQRKELNSYLRNQFFPRKLVPLGPIILVFHTFSNTFFFWLYIDFFNRKLRSIDNFGLVKAIEVRNALFYGLVPHLISFMQIEQYSHLALYVCAMRLLHSGDIFDDKTSEVADQLFTEFYKDHDLFYKTSQSLKLHLHAHFASLYETHGSLCNLGCFGQESFIGSVSSNHHGTQFYDDSITHFYNIDFAIQDKKKGKIKLNGPYDQASTSASDYDYLLNFHSFICTCNDVNSCIKIFRRFINYDKMFHSLLYKKRHNSVSYFVRYSFSDNVQEQRFGAIDLFFMFNGFGYTLIKYYPVKEFFSDAFKKLLHSNDCSRSRYTVSCITM